MERGGGGGRKRKGGREVEKGEREGIYEGNYYVYTERKSGRERCWERYEGSCLYMNRERLYMNTERLYVKTERENGGVGGRETYTI